MADQCAFVKDDGEQCSIQGGLEEFEGEPRCIWHDPGRRDQAQQARRKGAGTTNDRRRGRVPEGEIPDPPEGLEDVPRLLSWATTAPLRGYPPSVVNAVVYATTQYVAAVKAADEFEGLKEDVETLKRRNGMEATG